MDATEYITAVTGQMRCKRARETVAAELKGHIEDQKDAYRSQGMSEAEASAEAVRQMGDAVEVGMEMDRIHRPRLSKRLLVLITVIAAAGGLIQYFVSSQVRDASPGLVLSTILTVVFSMSWMLAIQFLDYTFIGKHSLAVWIATLGCAGVNFLIGNSMLRNDSVTSTVGQFLLLGLMLPAYCGIVYRYRNGGWKGLLYSILWLLPAMLVYRAGNGAAPAGISTMKILLVIFGCLLVLTYALAEGWYQVKRWKALLSVWGTLGLLLCAGYQAFLSGYGETFQLMRVRAFLDPGGYPADYRTLTIRGVLSGIRLVGGSPEAGGVAAEGWLTFYLVLSRLGIAAALMLAVLFAVLLAVMLAGVKKQKNILGGIVGAACVLGIFIPLAAHILTNLTLLPAADIYLPFCYPSIAMNAACYTLMGFYLSVYRNTDVVA